MEDYYDSNDYFNTAAEASKLALLALPKPPSYQTIKCADFDLNTTEVADFIAGFMEGFTGNNKKTGVEQCFKDTDPFEQDICDIVADIRTKDNQKIA